MMKSSALEQMNHASSNAAAILQELKAKSARKMLGIFHPIVPEEIVYAAGFHPTKLLPHFNEPITSADAYFQTFVCSNVRSIFDQALKGKYPYLDGVIIPTSCEAVTYAYQTWKRHNPYPFITSIVTPLEKTENTIDFFAKELGRLKGNLESLSGKPVSEDSLRQAIQVYNKNRELLRKIYALRKSESPPVSGVEAYNIVKSSFILDKAKHNELLEQLLADIQNGNSPAKAGPRILVSGGCVVDVRVWETIESAGGLIVADDTNNGTRSFCGSVDTEKEPLKALAEHYMAVPCAFITSAEERLKHISEMIAEYKADGVIFAIQKYCESEKFDLPFLQAGIRDNTGVPVMLIETDYLADMAPLETRVGAFIESLRMR